MSWNTKQALTFLKNYRFIYIYIYIPPRQTWPSSSSDMKTWQTLPRWYWLCCLSVFNIRQFWRIICLLCEKTYYGLSWNFAPRVLVARKRTSAERILFKFKWAIKAFFTFLQSRTYYRRGIRLNVAWNILFISGSTYIQSAMNPVKFIWKLTFWAERTPSKSWAETETDCFKHAH